VVSGGRGGEARQCVQEQQAEERRKPGHSVQLSRMWTAAACHRRDTCFYNMSLGLLHSLSCEDVARSGGVLHCEALSIYNGNAR